MKSITQYFTTFEEAAEKVNHLFTTYLQVGFLVQSSDEIKITEDDISFNKVVADLQFEKKHQEMLALLGSAMMDYGIKYLKDRIKIDPDNVLDVFGAGNIAFLVVGEWVEATLDGTRKIRNYTADDDDDETRTVIFT